MCTLNYTDCTDEDCSRIFNLCGNICTNIHQEELTELPTAPNPQITTDSVNDMKPINACPTNTSCTPTTITSCTTTAIVSPDSTASTIGQNCFNVTSTVLSTIIKTQEMTLIITHTTTPTPWTTCPQTTITSTKFIATTVLSPLQSCAPQFTTTPKLNITKSPTTSLGLESCSGNKSGLPTQGNGSSSTISALGALLGLSLVLLALVTAGWVWTCWTARKRGEVNINSKTNK